jgi:hypothetical protein
MSLDLGARIRPFDPTTIQKLNTGCFIHRKRSEDALNSSDQTPLILFGTEDEEGQE